MTNLETFQQLLKTNGYDAYIIPTSDFHNSEYVSDYFKGRSFLSGFTGSSGTLVVTLTDARLWTDGRYFIQAEKQLAGSGIHLMKMGTEGIPSIKEFLQSIFRNGGTLGFDGRCLSNHDALDYTSALTKNVIIKSELDLIDTVWTDRPDLPFSFLYKLDEFFCGESKVSKLAKIREVMSQENADYYLLTALDDQAWLYNLRGNDVSHTPVFLSYTLISKDNVTLFVDNKKINDDIHSDLTHCGITLKDYNDIFHAAKNLKNSTVMLDPKFVNYQLVKIIAVDNKIIEKTNPTLMFKAIKNETEIKNTRLAHIKDGVAFTKFMYYTKNNVQTEHLSELSVSDYLADLRASQLGFVDLSFNTICAYKDHGAMMHYSATKETNYTLDSEGFLLIDSGGHYLDGTTDITRTIALGNLTKEMKLHFTTVLKSVIALSSAVFLKGVKGVNLDILARGPIWKLLIDYKCGTGHGVGYLLSVHEGPNGFRWQVSPERDSAVLEPGMITTNEPGIYLENKYGIRTEQELLVVEAGETQFGHFYKFETITYAPIDIDCIDAKLLSKDELAWLNNYHQLVYEKLSPYLNEKEIAWLKLYTKAL